MNIHTQVSNENLNKAIAFVNGLGRNEAFWSDIAAIDGFDDADPSVTGAVLADLLRNYNDRVEVRLYRKFWPWQHRKTNAYVEPQSRNIIFYNEKKLGRTAQSMSDTIMHEFVHVVDYGDPNSPKLDFGHHGNSAHGNENTAPYVIGKIAGEYFSKSQTG